MYTTVRGDLITTITANTPTTTLLGQDAGGLPMVHKNPRGIRGKYHDHEIPALAVDCSAKGRAQKRVTRGYVTNYVGYVETVVRGGDKDASWDKALAIMETVILLMEAENAQGRKLGNTSLYYSVIPADGTTVQTGTVARDTVLYLFLT